MSSEVSLFYVMLHGINQLCNAFWWYTVNLQLVILFFFVYTFARERLVCILSKIKSLVGYSTVYHSKAYYCTRLVCIALQVYKLNLQCTD